MKEKIQKKFLTLALFFTCMLSSPIIPTANASFFAGATEPTQIGHNAVNNAGWLWDAQAWLQDRVTDLDKWMELIENNVLTRAIRGFNELMTAIQGDISDVLGTIDTLMNMPLNVFDEILGMPGSIMGMFEGNPFQGVFSGISNIMGTIGEYQALGNMDFEQIFGFNAPSGFTSPFELSNSISGTRSKLGADFLNQSAQREDMYRRWRNDSGDGNDAIQLQRTQVDIMKEVVKNQNRDQEFIMMDRMQQNADRIMMYEREKSRANRLYTDAHFNLVNQIW